MFCSTCGVSVAQGLSYCNYCGANLKRDDDKEGPKIRPEALIFGMLATFVFGMVAITILIGVLRNALQLEVNLVLGVALFPFLVLLLLESVFIRLLLSQHKTGKRKDKKALSEGRPTNELDAAEARMLPSTPGSVTEGTTRAFEPVITERSPK